MKKHTAAIERCTRDLAAARTEAARLTQQQVDTEKQLAELKATPVKAPQVPTDAAPDATEAADTTATPVAAGEGAAETGAQPALAHVSPGMPAEIAPEVAKLLPESLREYTGDESDRKAKIDFRRQRADAVRRCTLQVRV